jgi:hypothetical protein
VGTVDTLCVFLYFCFAVCRGAGAGTERKKAVESQGSGLVQLLHCVSDVETLLVAAPFFPSHRFFFASDFGHDNATD